MNYLDIENIDHNEVKEKIKDLMKEIKKREYKSIKRNGYKLEINGVIHDCRTLEQAAKIANISLSSLYRILKNKIKYKTTRGKELEKIKITPYAY